MAFGALAGFWGVSLFLVLTPGADWAYMIGAGLRGRSVLPAAAGLLVGYLVLTAVVSVGVATLVASSPLLLSVLTATGAVYLLWLGLSNLVRPAGPVSAADAQSGSFSREAVKGAGISTLNPKGLLLFLALLPQFTSTASTLPVAGQILLLGVVHTLSCAVVDIGVGVGARAVLSARPGWARVVSRSSGAVMLALGLALLAEQFVA